MNESRQMNEKWKVMNDWSYEWSWERMKGERNEEKWIKVEIWMKERKDENMEIKRTSVKL